MNSIATERLLLRPFRLDDETAVHAYTSDPEVTRYTSWTPHTPAATRARLRAWVADQEHLPRTSIHLAIESREHRMAIGWAGFVSIDADRQTGIFGYLLNRDFWGKGLASEAAAGLVRWGFTELNLHRVVAEVSAENVPSTKILEKLGMRREAHFRKNIMKDGEWRDTFLYALLREEWQLRSDP
ncbi:MAG TPA: GNAT family N-acetyltransferase [Bryobacteraceae bacterium]|jgi:RimJ/RimL family protein N-acetyltransferase|nr:GNAT family N-acetyltransferase [Bryobacteraceae bacterium]